MCSQECVLPVPDEIVGGLIDEMYRYEQDLHHVHVFLQQSINPVETSRW